MAEASVSRFKDNEEEGSEQPQQILQNSDSQATGTPLTVADKAANNDLQVQQMAPELEEEKKKENTHQIMEDEDYSDCEENEATK